MSEYASTEYYWYAQLGTHGSPASQIWAEDTSLGSVSWTDIDDGSCLVDSIKWGLGPNPDVAVLRIEASSAHVSGRVFDGVAVELLSTRRPDGTDGNMPVPAVNLSPNYQLKPFSLIRIVEAQNKASKPGTGIFVGIVTGYKFTSDGQNEYCLVTVSEIARWHMERIGLYGGYCHEHQLNSALWDGTMLPVFNEDSRPNQWMDLQAGSPVSWNAGKRFIAKDYNHSNGAAKDTSLDYADYWKLGDIINYLRDQYNQSGSGLGESAVSTANYLNWPEASTGTPVKWDFLFDDAQGGDDNELMNFALGGLSLCEGIDEIVRKAGPYNWHCVWDDVNKYYTLTIFDARTGNGTTRNLDRGALGGDIVTGTPAAHIDVIGLDLEYSWEKARNTVIGLGQKAKYDVSFDNGSGSGYIGGLQKGWDDSTGGDESAYDSATGADKASLKYAHVYRRFVFTKNISWTSFLPAADVFFGGPREPLPSLLSEVYAKTADGDYTKVKLRPLVYWDKDGTWTLAPDTVGVQLLPEGGVLISGSEGGVRWAKGKTIRVTLAVEADGRQFASSTDTGNAAPKDHWPTLECVTDARDRMRYEAHSGAYLPVDSGNNPVFDNPNSLATLGSSGAPHVINDDQYRFEAEVQRTQIALSRPVVRGTILLHEPMTAWDAGDIIGNLTGGGNRDTIPLNAVISEITIADMSGKPHTIIEVGSGHI